MVWELIELPESEVAPRFNPVFIQISEKEIAIMGGYSENGFLSDFSVFNFKSNKCLKVFDDGEYKFSSQDNQSALIGN